MQTAGSSSANSLSASMSLPLKSVFDESTVLCARCKTGMGASFVFCVNCGLRRTQSNLDVEVVHVQTKPIHKDPPRASAKKTKAKKQKPVADASILTLPKKIVDAIESKLSEPILNNTIIARRLAQQLQTQTLELKNAEGVEIVAHNKFLESLSLGEKSIIVQSEPEDLHRSIFSAAQVSSAQVFAGGSVSQKSTKSATKERRKKRAKKGKSTEYLANVESVSTHYALYMSRLKQLEGLRAALMDPPPLISEVLRQRDAQLYDSQVADIYSRIVSSSVGLLAYPENTADVEASQQPAPAYGLPVSAEEDLPEIALSHGKSADNGGMAFMWGPIFNSDASESVGAQSIEGTSFLAEGVVRLNASAVLQESPSSSMKSRESPQSRSFRPISETVASAAASPVGSAKSGLQSAVAMEVRPVAVDTESVPVVMFWGNVLGSEQQVTETNEARMSRTSSFRSSPNQSSYHSRATSPASSADASFASQHEAAEAELPVWIEALAAETAGIREDFYAEDTRIMRKLDARLGALDAGNMRQMSRRALMVQYSMDGVVREYREKIRHMKANLTLEPASPSSRPNTGEGDPYSDAEGEEGNKEKVTTGQRMSPLLLRGSVLGPFDEEEQRGVDEEEEKAAPEAPQSVWTDVPVAVEPTAEEDAATFPTVAALHRSVVPELRGSLTMDRGQIFEVIEEQESNLAHARQHEHVDDEVLMQELILSLTSAHQKRFGSRRDAAVGGISTVTASNTEGDLAERGTEERIRERLRVQEQQEAAESEMRNRADEADEVAMKQWLVAVSATDADRARKQTLRTLKMEEMEDGGADSDDDEASVSSSVQARTAAGASGADELIVSENHSLHRIKAVYRQSCSKMLALLPELEVDFTVDQTEHPEFRTAARSKVFLARKVLKASTAVDHKAALEYRAFLEHCALRRAALAMKLSEAMRRASELEKTYRERYAQATREFKSSADAMLADTSDTAKQVNSSKHMRAIQKSAELDIAQQGQVVKALQADEAKLLLDIRQEQFVLSEVLNLWQARHSKVLGSYSVAYKRFYGLLESYRGAPKPAQGSVS